MKIDGAAARGQPASMGGSEVHWVAPPPALHKFCDEPFTAREVPARRSTLLRAGLSSLRQQTLQNAPAARANTTPPGPNSTDRQLASELEKHFGELHEFLKDGRLTQSSLRQIGDQALRGE